MIERWSALARTGWTTWRNAIAERTSQWRLAVRFMVAGGAALVLSQSLALPQGYWSVMTAIIVIQSNVGGSLKAAWDRMLGTMFGAVAGLIAVTLMPPTLMGNAASFALALLPTTMAAAANPAYRIAPITAVMLMMSTQSALSPIELGIDRILEIALGGLVGLAVSLTVLPARAHRDLRQTLQEALHGLADAIEPMLVGLSGTRDDVLIRALHRRVRATLGKADTLADEARRERLARLTEERDPDALVAVTRRLQTNLLLLGRATARPLPDVLKPELLPKIRLAGDSLRSDFLAVAESLTKRGQPPDLSAVEDALGLLNQALVTLRAQGRMHDLSVDEIEGLFALAFALGQFRRDVVDLHARLADLATTGAI